MTSWWFGLVLLHEKAPIHALPGPLRSGMANEEV